MAVVINDFEVVVESPAAPEAADEPGAPAPSAGPTPQELELVSRRLHERAARVRAD